MARGIFGALGGPKLERNGNATCGGVELFKKNVDTLINSMTPGSTKISSKSVRKACGMIPTATKAMGSLSISELSRSDKKTCADYLNLELGKLTEDVKIKYVQKMIEKGNQHEEVQHFILVLEELSSEISNPKNNILEFITLFTSNDSKRLEGLKESNRQNSEFAVLYTVTERSKTETNGGGELASLYEQNLREALALSRTQADEDQALDSSDEQNILRALALSRIQPNDDRKLDSHRYEQDLRDALALSRTQANEGEALYQQYMRAADADYQSESEINGLGAADADYPKPSAPPNYQSEINGLGAADADYPKPTAPPDELEEQEEEQLKFAIDLSLKRW